VSVLQSVASQATALDEVYESALLTVGNIGFALRTAGKVLFDPLSVLWSGKTDPGRSWRPFSRKAFYLLLSAVNGVHALGQMEMVSIGRYLSVLLLVHSD
jgi:hypothetical protein